jgi:hypothetical protein
MQAAALGVTLALVVAPTVRAAAGTGIDVLTVLSVLVLAVSGAGIVGALLHPPES